MPTDLTPGNGIDSLTRTGNTNSNRADFALACPTPTDNGVSGMPGMTGEDWESEVIPDERLAERIDSCQVAHYRTFK